MKYEQKIGNLRYLLAAAALLVFLGMVLGGLGRVGALGEGISFGVLHRAFEIAAGVLSIVALIIAGSRYKQYAFIWKMLGASSGMILLQIGLGLAAGLDDFTSGWLGLHFGLALAILGSTTAASVYAFGLNLDAEVKPSLSFRSRFARKAILAVSLVSFVMVSGVIVANAGARIGCEGWPLCNGRVIPLNDLEAVVLLHRFVVAGVGVFMISFTRHAWRTQRTQRAILTAATIFSGLYLAQSYVGALKAVRAFPISMLALHEATAGAILAVGAILLVVVGLAQRTDIEEQAEALENIDWGQRAKDFLALTKPVVVSLLLSTTLAGMIIAAGKFPSFSLFFWTMLGGALAAGGSSAINQYIDRDLDQLMTRTAKRPIPAGRLTPAEGLAFGAAALLASFYLLAGFVNMLAALLSLAGMIYYVVLYSLYLKKRSEHNIVIGGGAGAIPPMVGWAAATGSLNLTAWFLFIIIFLWTPPHFWALALLREKEYAKGGVPMMPVVRGDEATRKLIYIYTIILVFATILLWVLGLVGLVYLIGAALLGAYLISLAWQVLKVGRNKVYHQMYRHSNYYLFLLFVVLAVDAVV